MKGIIQEMFSYVEENPNKEIAVEGSDIREECGYNPAKGETHQGEIGRWISFIDNVYNIKSYYDFTKDRYVFAKFIK